MKGRFSTWRELSECEEDFVKRKFFKCKENLFTEKRNEECNNMLAKKKKGKKGQQMLVVESDSYLLWRRRENEIDFCSTIVAPRAGDIFL